MSELGGRELGRGRIADSASRVGLTHTQEEERRGNIAMRC